MNGADFDDSKLFLLPIFRRFPGVRAQRETHSLNEHLGIFLEHTPTLPLFFSLSMNDEMMNTYELMIHTIKVR